MLYIGSLQTPIGTIIIQGNETELVSVSFSDFPPPIENSNHIITVCKQQLNEYFDHSRTTFELPINMSGTEFQKNVWNSCSSIQYGNTASYKKLAQNIHNEKSAIAVGQALKNNPFHIVIPCHRILNSQFKNTGYAGGIWRKDWLLNFEKIIVK